MFKFQELIALKIFKDNRTVKIVGDLKVFVEFVPWYYTLSSFNICFSFFSLKKYIYC